jgi:hypothetical protein
MKDPLGQVYLGKADTGGAVVFGKTPNKIDDYYLDKGAKKKDTDEFDDLNPSDLGGVWEVDVDNLTKDYLDYLETKKSYEKERDPSKKAQIFQEGIKKSAKLRTYIEKSKKNKAAYYSTAQDINKDDKYLYDLDAKEKLDNDFKGKSIYDRSDDPGVKRPSSLDFTSMFTKKFKAALGAPNVTTEKSIVGDKTVQTQKKYYTPDDVKKAADAAMSTMPANYINSQRVEFTTRLSQNDPYALSWMAKNAQSTDPVADYSKAVGVASVQPLLLSEGIAVMPHQKKKSGGGGGAADKFSTTANVRTFIIPNAVAADGAVTGPVTSEYVEIQSAPKSNARMAQLSWKAPTKTLKANYPKVKGSEFSTDPNMTVLGTFSGLYYDTKSKQMMVSITPTDKWSSFDMAHPQITLPYKGNEAVIKSLLNGRDPQEMVDEVLQGKESNVGKQASKDTSMAPKAAGSKTGTVSKPATGKKDKSYYKETYRRQ